MYTNIIIMMNIKSIFITTGISFLFGVYSIYNLLEYLRVLNNDCVKQITSMQHLVNETNKKYNELRIKYSELKKNYNDLSIDNQQINSKIASLNHKIIELQWNKPIDITIGCISNVTSSNDLFKETNNIVCDELCNLNNEIPKIHMETMNGIEIMNGKEIKHSEVNVLLNDIDEEFIESLSFISLHDYDCNESRELTPNNSKLVSSCNSEKSSVKARSRSTSITEINWSELTKNFFFG